MKLITLLKSLQKEEYKDFEKFLNDSQLAKGEDWVLVKEVFQHKI